MPVIQVPKEDETPAANVAVKHVDVSAPTNSAPVKAMPKSQPPPAPPPKPVNAQTAILQALDKITTETRRVSAPVGQRVRYKNLVFVVKACETTGLGSASPQASAYVVIDSAPKPAPGFAPPPARQVFKGWMFANSPALHPFQHPVYDAWLIACIAAPPPAVRVDPPGNRPPVPAPP